MSTRRDAAPQPDITASVPRDHGESVVFQVEIETRVYSFELDREGNVCAESGYIELTPGPHNHHVLALEAARDMMRRIPNFLEVQKEMCGSLRAVRCGNRLFEFKSL